MNADRAKIRSRRNALAREARRQAAINKKVFRALRHERDDMKSPRPFLHWAYFKTKTARRVFAAKIKKLGYAIVGETMPGSFGEALPYGIEFEAVSSMNPDVLAKSNAALSLLATRLGGEYDGWEVEVMRET